MEIIDKISEKENDIETAVRDPANVTMLSQLGLSFITPLLLCLALCWFIISKTGVGVWVYIPGFFFGMGGSATVAYKFYLSINKQQKKKHKKDKIYFNRHS